MKLQSKRIYYLSKRFYVADYMDKVKYKRIFEMKSNSPFNRLPRVTQAAIVELRTYNCEIKYVIK